MRKKGIYTEPKLRCFGVWKFNRPIDVTDDVTH